MRLHFAGNGEYKVKKKEGKYYTPEFRQMALERMKNSSSVSALAKELGIPRRILYDWREALEAHPETEASDREKLSLKKQLQETQKLLAKKTLEADFLKGALQKIEARRQKNEYATPSAKAGSRL